MSSVNDVRAAKQALKLADKFPHLYSDEEIIYMKKALREARTELQITREMFSKGFKNATTRISKVNVSNSRSGEDDGVCSESEQPSEPDQS